mgnify:CR=1 FL=1
MINAAYFRTNSTALFFLFILIFSSAKIVASEMPQLKCAALLDKYQNILSGDDSLRNSDNYKVPVARAFLSFDMYSKAKSLLSEIAEQQLRELVRSDLIEAMAKRSVDSELLEQVNAHEIVEFKIRSYAKMAQYAKTDQAVKVYFKAAEEALIVSQKGFWRERGAINLAEAYAVKGNFKRAMELAAPEFSGEFSPRAYFIVSANAAFMNDTTLAHLAFELGKTGLDGNLDAHELGKSKVEMLSPIIAMHDSATVKKYIQEIVAIAESSTNMDAAIFYADLADVLSSHDKTEALNYFGRSADRASMIPEKSGKLDAFGILLIYLSRDVENREAACGSVLPRLL